MRTDCSLSLCAARKVAPEVLDAVEVIKTTKHTHARARKHTRAKRPHALACQKIRGRRIQTTCTAKKEPKSAPQADRAAKHFAQLPHPHTQGLCA